MLEKILFIPDVHVPYEDKKAWRTMIAAAKVYRPDTVVVLGDFADFYCVSAHDKDPRRTMFLDRELAVVLDRLQELKALKAKRYVFICGNHEYRLERYLMQKAPELFNVIKIEDLFRLKENGWEYYPYKTHCKLGKLYITHDCGYAGIGSTRQSQKAFESNVLIGHNHRMDYHVSGNLKGKPHIGASFGWLGDPKKADYMHAVKAHTQWVHGFGIGYLEPNGHVHLIPVPIVSGKVIIEGKLVGA